MTAVRFPQMRQELIGNLQALSDPDYQQRIWVEARSQGTIEHDEFDYTIHFLYDDTELASNPRNAIGTILVDEVEVRKVADLIKALDFVFDKYGMRLADAQYITLPEWSGVVAAARAALKIIRE
jgi:hypothetical protein